MKNNLPTLGDRVVSIGKTVGGMATFFVGFALFCQSVQFSVGWIVAATENSGRAVI